MEKAVAKVTGIGVVGVPVPGKQRRTPKRHFARRSIGDFAVVGIDQPHLAKGADALGQPVRGHTRRDQIGGSRRQAGFGRPEGIQIGRVQKTGQFRDLMRRHQISHCAANLDPLQRQRVGVPFVNKSLQCPGHHHEPADPVA